MKQKFKVDITTTKGAIIHKTVDVHNLCVELQETVDKLLSGEKEETRNICVNLLGEACNNLKIVMTIINDPKSVNKVFEEEVTND